MGRKRRPFRVVSMTGQGEAEGRVGPYHVRVELRSLNHKYLDVQCSLPPGWESLEPLLRAQLDGRIHRGRVHVHVYVETRPDRLSGEDLEPIQRFLQQLKQLKIPRGVTLTVDLYQLLRQSGTGVRRHPAWDQELMAIVRRALERLIQSRRSEGKRLLHFYRKSLEELERGLRQARRIKEREIRRLQKKIQEMNHGENGDAALVLRKQIEAEEELTRLASHMEALREALKEPTPKGRRMEFLLQELHREWTTLAHKSQLPELIHLTIRMREVVDALKEQTRNVE
ncbi:MAG: DUF1732 domain-containing protein [Candidatus Hydrothermae bacterium]|nr:DUF1732 domain-containing protein [Candidatus Hydrothermae bacterium]